MMLNPTDRLLTIIVTATVTSAFWIVAGGSLMDMAHDRSQLDKTRPAEAAPSPDSTSAPTEPSASLDSRKVTVPGAAEAGHLLIPVLNVRASDLSDTFTDERGGGDHLHQALDIMAPEGTTVVAAAPGTIEKLFRSDAGGNTIYVRSGDKQTIYYYAHLKEYAAGLKEGQSVRRGQRLGSVGHTGNAPADAPHLHFAMMRTTPDAHWWEPATAVNPYPLLKRNAP
jgi:murein DD-endopeptidase MepM/ murein hydrolase activator NlpD